MNFHALASSTSNEDLEPRLTVTNEIRTVENYTGIYWNFLENFRFKNCKNTLNILEYTGEKKLRYWNFAQYTGKYTGLYWNFFKEK